MILGRLFKDAIKADRIWIEDGQAYRVFCTFWWKMDKNRPRKFAFIPCDMPKEES